MVKFHLRKNLISMVYICINLLCGAEFQMLLNGVTTPSICPVCGEHDLGTDDE